MKRLTTMALSRVLAVSLAAVLLLGSVTAEAHGDRRYYHRRGDWWGPALGVGLVLGSAAIVANAYEPPRYRQPVVVMPAPVVAMPPAASVWYFCADSNSYYPAVPDCPSGWRIVPAQPAPVSYPAHPGAYSSPYPYPAPYPPPPHY